MRKLIVGILAIWTLFTGSGQVHAQEESQLSIQDLPFQGYYLAPEEYGVSGILFEGNQLWVYIEDDTRYSHGAGYHMHDDHDHDHGHGHDDHDHDDYGHDDHGHDDATDRTPDHAFIEYLFELNSFPHPDLKNYTESVRRVYIEEQGLPYDLQATYLELAEKMTPEMGQRDVIKLINDHIPGIYYTEGEGFMYFIVASPQVHQDGDRWVIELFGNELFDLAVEGRNLVDPNGTVYEYIDGIRPN